MRDDGMMGEKLLVGIGSFFALSGVFFGGLFIWELAALLALLCGIAFSSAFDLFGVAFTDVHIDSNGIVCHHYTLFISDRLLLPQLGAPRFLTHHVHS
jgi:hypothetical protein